MMKGWVSRLYETTGKPKFKICVANFQMFIYEMRRKNIKNRTAISTFRIWCALNSFLKVIFVVTAILLYLKFDFAPHFEERHDDIWHLVFCASLFRSASLLISTRFSLFLFVEFVLRPSELTSSA
jgi:hypothetical protein